MAEGTNEATAVIETLITNIQNEIDATNNSIQSIEEKVKTSIESSKETVKSIGLIIDISKTISYILDMMTEQSKVILEVKENIIVMAEQNKSNMVVDEQSSTDAIELVNYIIRQTDKLSKVIESLEYSTDDLESIIGAFIIAR